MKKFSIILFSVAIFFFHASAQTPEKGRAIPSVAIKTLKGESFNTSSISNDGKPVIISFWATWCKPCIEELNNISEVYPEWQKETGVKIYAVSIDDARTMQRVAPFVNGKKWTYNFLLDPNSDFKRTLNVNMPPHTFLVNGKGEIVWQHVGYVDGNEEELYEEVKKVAAAK
ncbi:MAG TPA: TlpA disulfide reductase family protein [Bacteroidia bacterium]|nr:TlpA disulfide reductase family protein [Bacteroidia bacterium]